MSDVGEHWIYKLALRCSDELVLGGQDRQNLIRESGAVALAKALESGKCQLKRLNLFRESVCLAACAAGSAPFLPAARFRSALLHVNCGEAVAR